MPRVARNALQKPFLFTPKVVCRTKKGLASAVLAQTALFPKELAPAVRSEKSFALTPKVVFLRRRDSEGCVPSSLEELLWRRDFKRSRSKQEMLRTPEALLIVDLFERVTKDVVLLHSEGSGPSKKGLEELLWRKGSSRSEQGVLHARIENPNNPWIWHKVLSHQEHGGH